MSLTFTQIVSQIDKNCKSNRVSYPLADIVEDVNLALDDAFYIALDAGGTWNVDDWNHEDYPIIRTNLVSGQRDYTFTEDEQGNLILDIYKVLVADSSGVYHELKGVDQQTPNNNSTNVDSLTDGRNTSGTPTRYDKTANGFFLDVIPNYSYANGLKVYINREGSYFTTSDTTKKPGIDPLCHEYLSLKPSYKHARDNSLPNRKSLKEDMEAMEQRIRNRYGKREKDVKKSMTPNVENNR